MEKKRLGTEQVLVDKSSCARVLGGGSLVLHSQSVEGETSEMYCGDDGTLGYLDGYWDSGNVLSWRGFHGRRLAVCKRPIMSSTRAATARSTRAGRQRRVTRSR